MRLLTNVFAMMLLLISITLIVSIIRMGSQEPVTIVPVVKKKDVPLPSQLHPKVEEAKEQLVSKAKKKGINIVITGGHRTSEEQNELYAKGRTKEGNVVTYAQGGESYHNYGLAIDFALQLNNGKVVWDTARDDNGNGTSDWMEVVAIAKDLGFEWGGDWKNFKDYPHLQMDFGLTVRDLQYGKRPSDTAYVEEE